MENRSLKSLGSIKNNMPVILFLASILAALLFIISDNISIKEIAAGTIPVFLGSAFGFWGYEAVINGYVHGHRMDVYRAKHPIMFWLNIFFSHFLPAVALISAGLYFMFTGHGLELR